MKLTFCCSLPEIKVLAVAHLCEIKLSTVFACVLHEITILLKFEGNEHLCSWVLLFFTWTQQFFRLRAMFWEKKNSLVFKRPHHNLILKSNVSREVWEKSQHYIYHLNQQPKQLQNISIPLVNKINVDQCQNTNGSSL